MLLNYEINKILGKLQVDLAVFRLKWEFFEKPYEYNSIKKERKLRILTKKTINKIERLKEEVKNNETKIFKLTTDLKYEKHSAFTDIAVLESKLIKLEISLERIARIKNSVLSS